MEEGGGLMRYWLFKSEPDVWGWTHQLAKGAAGQACCLFHKMKPPTLAANMSMPGII
jgi:hypothetical protein